MPSLSDLIKGHISKYGPMTVQDYWLLALSHPEHGYYIKQDPFGRPGDFITAPEISQMFGEMLGIWVADLWMKMGSPSPFILVECGAGRGTMMEDLLRATERVPGFHDKLEVHIVETSPALREIQKQKLNGHNVIWHDDLSTVSSHAPMILLANEFLDALPIRQVVNVKGKWHERVIGLQDDKLAFGFGSEIPLSTTVDAPDGSVFEYSTARDAVWAQVIERLRKQGGAALVIDYGHAVTGMGDTLQAMRDHKYCDPLEEPGEVDITSHVNFARLADLAEGLNPRVATQGDFLKRLGIEIRANTLAKNATDDQVLELQAGLKRLIDADQMGDLFKVLSVTNPPTLDPVGFND